MLWKAQKSHSALKHAILRQSQVPFEGIIKEEGAILWEFPVHSAWITPLPHSYICAVTARYNHHAQQVVQPQLHSDLLAPGSANGLGLPRIPLSYQSSAFHIVLRSPEPRTGVGIMRRLFTEGEGQGREGKRTCLKKRPVGLLRSERPGVHYSSGPGTTESPSKTNTPREPARI